MTKIKSLIVTTPWLTLRKKRMRINNSRQMRKKRRLKISRKRAPQRKSKTRILKINKSRLKKRKKKLNRAMHLKNKWISRLIIKNRQQTKITKPQLIRR